uniref:shikimate dehydrogenase family protein n=1 Tax=Flavobacterium sp. TaxID=239 RepID=UPI00404ACCDC
MERTKRNNVYGLIGKDIEYSFSRNYFKNKFEQENRFDCEYVNFDLKTIDSFPKIFENINQNIAGLNVTVPYKEAIMPFLDEISANAKQIGAVNCIEITESGKKIGHNTDWIGFTTSLKPFLKENKIKALILGTGGASKGIQFALKKLKIPFKLVSSSKKGSQFLKYEKIDEEHIITHQLIINCTPLGTYPDIENTPDIPFQYLNAHNIIYDLVYNPPFTQLMKKAAVHGSIIKNGHEMLEIQADESWKIWTNSPTQS